MRKLLGLLVAAVFVAMAAGSAMAQTAGVASLSTATAADSYHKFRAEIIFFQLGTASFDFALFNMGSAVKPSVGTPDPAATEIHWKDYAAGVIVPGNDGPAAGPTDKFFASKVYAKISNKAFTPKTKVLIYTDNTFSLSYNTALSTMTNYYYKIDTSTTPYGVGSADTINALVEKSGTTGLNTSAGYATLPLAYRIEVSSRVDAGTYDITAANFADQ